MTWAVSSVLWNGRLAFESGAIARGIDRTFALADAPAALRYLADGHARGKIVVTI
ncbi:MAG: zinc-binding dehydrogenase [Acidimicrobiales bacterium]